MNTPRCPCGFEKWKREIWRTQNPTNGANHSFHRCGKPCGFHTKEWSLDNNQPAIMEQMQRPIAKCMSSTVAADWSISNIEVMWRTNWCSRINRNVIFSSHDEIIACHAAASIGQPRYNAVLLSFYFAIGLTIPLEREYTRKEDKSLWRHWKGHWNKRHASHQHHHEVVKLAYSQKKGNKTDRNVCLLHMRWCLLGRCACYRIPVPEQTANCFQKLFLYRPAFSHGTWATFR